VIGKVLQAGRFRKFCAVITGASNVSKPFTVPTTPDMVTEIYACWLLEGRPRPEPVRSPLCIKYAIRLVDDDHETVRAVTWPPGDDRTIVADLSSGAKF
jgi:hypothetical protein